MNRYQARLNSHIKRGSDHEGIKRFFLTLFGAYLTLSVFGECSAQAQDSFSFVPDRPGYADATASVDRGRWHLEFGGSWLPEQDTTVAGLLRYGLGQGWEIRLTSPTLLQGFSYQDASGQDITPDLLVGGTQLGTKWAKQWSKLEFSAVFSVGLPLTGTQQALNLDPLMSLTSQVSHSLSSHMATGLCFKYALTDGNTYQNVAYGEALAHVLGLVGSLAWSDIGWSLFVQAGAELYDEVLTPLVGSGLTFRVTQGSQIDFSLDAPLASDGVQARYMLGLTLAW